jgi:large subunit ribosomal protein L29
MRAKELRERTNEELSSLVRRLKEELLNFRFQNFGNRLKDKTKISKTKKDIARIKTILRERELNEKARNRPKT